MRSLNKKGALDMSFGWIFAIIAGGIILSLAIYGVVKFTDIQKTQQSAETSKNIDSLLNPLESSFETGQKVTITAPVETRIYVKCNTDGGLGSQRIQTAQKTFNQWSDNGPSILSKDKYIFVESPAEAEGFTIFSKSFSFPTDESYEFPFKVADLIYLIPNTKTYCFLDSPQDIESEINDLNIDNVKTENCNSGDIRVCFGSSGDCDIEVGYSQGIVEKQSKRVYFESDALMYGAIFSDEANYECQLERLIGRAEDLSKIYQEKSRIEREFGCDGDLESDLIIFENLLESFSSSRDIIGIGNQAKVLNKLNSRLGDCKLW